MLKTHLYQIKQDLQGHHRSKSSLLEYYIQQRLMQSLHTYYKEVSQSAQYLYSKNPTNIIRNL